MKFEDHESNRELREVMDGRKMVSGFVARFLGVDVKTVQNWKRGKHKVPYAALVVFRALAQGAMNFDFPSARPRKLGSMNSVLVPSLFSVSTSKEDGGNDRKSAFYWDLVRATANGPTESGKIHESEGIIEKALAGDVDGVVLEWLFEWATDRGNSPLACDVMVCMARQRVKVGDVAYRLKLVKKILNEGDVSMRYAVLDFIEWTEDMFAKAVLMEHEEEDKWLREEIRAVMVEWRAEESR